MLNAIANVLLQIVLWISSAVVSIISYPIYTALYPFIPDLNSHLANFNTYINDYVVRGLAFSREVFFNVTGYPRPLFYALVTFFLFKLAFRMTVLIFVFIMNIYLVIRGSKSSNAGQ